MGCTQRGIDWLGDVSKGFGVSDLEAPKSCRMSACPQCPSTKVCQHRTPSRRRSPAPKQVPGVSHEPRFVLLFARADYLRFLPHLLIGFDRLSDSVLLNQRLAGQVEAEGSSHGALLCRQKLLVCAAAPRPAYGNN
eukprot:1204938-Pleurochrysis_carterae.AAC.1